MKIYKYISCLFLISISVFCYSQQYAVSAIPASLTDDAYAVIRKDDTKVEFINYDKLRYSNEYVITVFNESGLRYGIHPLYYDKRMKISKYTAVIYDKDGKEIKKLKSKDLKDISVYDGSALFVDYRLQYYEFTPVSYPFTVQYYQEYTTSNTIVIPDWESVGSYNLGIENSTYELTNSSSIQIRKKESGFDGWKVNKTEIGNKLSYSIQDIPPVQEEILSPVLSELSPRVKLIPNKFQLEGVNGSFENWEQFGKWYYSNLLNNKRDLTSKDKQTVSQLIGGVSDPVEKVKILYQYMQSKTRYVNVVIGIGGWEPFPASYVGDKSYGDCKALSNYMISLLDYAGIEAFYTIVYGNSSRKQDMDGQFASLQGNHIIVNVPLDDETIWLECTSQQTAFNYLGSFTDDRHAISIKPNGAEVVSTQKYTVDQNLNKISGQAELSADGKLNMNFELEDHGLLYDGASSIYFESEKDRVQSLRSMFSEVPNFDMKNYELTNDRDNAVFKASIQFESGHYASVVGNSLLINLLPVGKSKTGLKKNNNRKYPFEIRFGYTDVVEFDLKLPNGYKLNEKFDNIIYMTEFGNYLLAVKDNGDGSLRIHRTMTVKDGNYTKDKFNDFVEFTRKISSFDNAKILLEKN